MVQFPLEEERYPRLLDWLRYFCAFLLYMYGSSKLLHLQFNRQTELAHRAVGSLNGYELTWYYFGLSRAYACVLGVTQVAGATLLLFRRTTLAGALAMLPVMVNIVLINMFILVNDYGPYLTSSLIVASLLIIVWHYRADLWTVLWSVRKGEPAGSRRLHWWIRSVLVLMSAGLMIGGAIIQERVRMARERSGQEVSAPKSNR